MPELPEVETIRRGLQAILPGQRVERVERGPHVLRKPSPRPLEDLVGRRVHRIRRHAKVLFWDLDGGSTFVAHLGMTGKFLFGPPDEPVRPHTHLRIGLEDGTELRYVDPRRFGWLKLHGADDAPPDVVHYGPDALDPSLDAEAMEALLTRSRAPLKSFLMDQTKVAGLGNIYVCEALWRARLSPRRLACNVPRRRVQGLLDAIRGVLEDSLRQGGTSFNDYVDAIGRPGSFSMSLAVFQREGLPCPRCQAAVTRRVDSGRSTFSCPSCQR